MYVPSDGNDVIEMTAALFKNLIFLFLIVFPNVRYHFYSDKHVAQAFNVRTLMSGAGYFDVRDRFQVGR